MKKILFILLLIPAFVFGQSRIPLQESGGHLWYYPPTGGPFQLDQQTGGITNGAANNELMKSDGTDAVSSGITVSSPGILEISSGESINLKSLAVATSSTGTAIQFDKARQYGVSSAETGNFTLNTTGLLGGLTQFVRHNNGTAPTFSSAYKIISGTYVTGVDNYIFMYSISTTLVLVTIAQEI